MRFLTTIFFSVSVLSQLNAQWTKVVLRNDALVTEEITDAYFINPDTGFISTAKGVLYKTIDGCHTWEFDTVNKGGIIYRIFFPNQDTGYITVGGGTYGNSILKTTNTGGSWVNVSQGNNINVGRGLYFFNADSGMVGVGNGLYQTNNGGQTWNHVFFADGGYNLGDLRFINDHLGFVYYQCIPNSEPLQASITISKDRGSSWMPQYFCNIAFSTYITTDNYYYLLNDSTFLGFDLSLRLIKSDLSLANRYYAFSGDSLASYNNLYLTPALNYPRNIQFYDELLGMVAYRNAVIRTEDGGNNWAITDFPFASDFDTTTVNPWLRYIVSITKDKWVVFGNSGRIYLTENRGGVWQDVKEIQDQPTFTLTPNPATTTLTITTNTNTTNTAGATAQIFTIEGKAATPKIPLANTNTVVDVAQLPKGLYFVALQSKEGTAVKKFVKNEQ